MKKSEWVITTIGLIVIAFVAFYLYKKETARNHQYEMYYHQRSLLKKIEPLDEALGKGKKLVDEKKYAEGRTSLEETKSLAQKLVAELDRELADCQSDLEQALFQPMRTQAKKVADEAVAILASDEVRFGAEGLVYFEGKWLKPDRIKEIEDRRFADAQRAKGLVQFEDKWVTPEERTQLKEKKFADEQLAKGLVLYRGEWVTTEKRQQLIAEARRMAQARPAPPPGAGPRPIAPLAAAAPTQTAFTPTSNVWMIDDFEAGIAGWQLEQWSDPSQVGPGTLDGSKAVSVEYGGGQQQKTALAHFMRPPMDVSSRAKILMDVQNNGKKSVKISIMLDADQAYETRDHMIAPGTRKDVAYDIKGAAFKCQTDGWQQYKFPLGKPEAVRRIMLMINTPGQIVIDNIRMVAQ